MIEDVTESFGDMIEGIDWDEAADMIGNVMDVAVDGLGWLSKNIKPVTTLVISLGSAWLTYKGVMAGANAVSTVANGLMTAKAVVTGTATAAVVTQTAATEAATVAQQGLNLAQMASPIALVTAGAVALGVGITLWFRDRTN